MTTDETHDLLQAGIAAAKQGHKSRARELLMEVLKLDERSESAWLWLSAVMDDVPEQIICLENVLTINPNHRAAARGLEALRAKLPPEPQAVPEPTPEPAAADWGAAFDEHPDLDDLRAEFEGPAADPGLPVEPPVAPPMADWSAGIDHADAMEVEAPLELPTPPPFDAPRERVISDWSTVLDRHGLAETEDSWDRSSSVPAAEAPAFEPEPATTPAPPFAEETHVCVHCGTVNPTWRALCSLCERPVMGGPVPKLAGVADFAEDDLDIEDKFAPRSQGLITLGAAWIAAIAFNKRGAYEYEILSASTGRTIIGMLVGGVVIPFLVALLVGVLMFASAAGDTFSTLTGLLATPAVLAIGALPAALGLLVGFYLWSIGIYLVAWLMGGKASFVVHSQLLSVAYVGSSLLLSLLLVIGGAAMIGLTALLSDGSVVAGSTISLGLVIALALGGSLYSLAMVGQAMSVAHRFSWLGGVGVVLLSGLIYGLLAVLVTLVLYVAGVAALPGLASLPALLF